jgi:hypothetical protein
LAVNFRFCTASLLQLAASGAQAADFDGVRLNFESMMLATGANRGADLRIVDLGDGAAPIADQKLCVVSSLPMWAAYESVQALDPVNKSCVHKEFE